jgi:hypothetical protein
VAQNSPRKDNPLSDERVLLNFGPGTEKRQSKLDRLLIALRLRSGAERAGVRPRA